VASDGTNAGGRVLRNTISNYLGKFFSLVVAFFLAPFVLHHIGTADYGFWALAGAVLSYGSLLDLGIAGAVVKYVAEYRARDEHEKAAGLVATSLAIYLVVGAAVLGIAALLAVMLPLVFSIRPSELSKYRGFVLLIGAGLGTSLPGSIPYAALVGIQRFDLVNVLRTTTVILLAILTVVVLLLGGGVLGLLAATLFTGLCGAGVGTALVFQVAPEVRLGRTRPSRRLAGKIIGYSLSTFVQKVGVQLQAETDEFVIGAALSVRSVTPYSFALKLSQVPQIAATEFLRLIVPLSSELKAGRDDGRLRQLYIASTRLTLALLFPLGTLVIVLAGPVLTLWIGSEYAHYANVVLILTVASGVVTSLWPGVAILQGIGRHRAVALTAIVSGGANLFLSLAFAHPFGLTGIALGTLIPSALESFGFVLPYVISVINVRLGDIVRAALLPAVLPLAPMGVVLWALPHAVTVASWFWIAVDGVVAFAVYGVVFVVVGVREEERIVWRGARQQMTRFVQIHSHSS